MDKTDPRRKAEGNKDSHDDRATYWLGERNVRSLRRDSETCEELQTLQEKLEAAALVEAAHATPIPWIKTAQADIIVGAMIAIYAILLGIDVEVTVRPIEVAEVFKSTLWTCQAVFMVLFVGELVLRVKADGWRYCAPSNPVGFFDSIVIVLGMVDIVVSMIGSTGTIAGVMRLLRLFRLVRLARVLLIKKELRNLLIGLSASCSAVFWAFLLLLIMMYVGALFCMTVLGDREDLSELFGSIGLSLWTHFMVTTQEAWPDVSDAVMAAAGEHWALYFICFICVTSLAVMNLVTGVVCEKLIENPHSQAEAQEEQLIAVAASSKQGERFSWKFRTKLKKICAAYTNDPVDLEQFREIMKSSVMRELLADSEIAADLSVYDLFDVLDEHGAGSLNSNDLANALLRLRGSSSRVHSVLLQIDLSRKSLRRRKHIAIAEENITQATHEDWALLRDFIEEKLDMLDLSVKSLEPEEEKGEEDAELEPGQQQSGAPPAAGADNHKVGLDAGSERHRAQAARLEQILARLDSLQVDAHALLEGPAPQLDVSQEEPLHEPQPVLPEQQVSKPHELRQQLPLEEEPRQQDAQRWRQVEGEQQQQPLLQRP